MIRGLGHVQFACLKNMYDGEKEKIRGIMKMYKTYDEISEYCDIERFFIKMN